MDVNPKPYAQISDHRDTFILDRPFVLTADKTLITGMPYLYSEGNRSAAVRLLKAWQEDHIIYLNVQEIKTLKTFSLSWNLNYTGDYWLWSLADFETLTYLPK